MLRYGYTPRSNSGQVNICVNEDAMPLSQGVFVLHNDKMANGVWVEHSAMRGGNPRLKDSFWCLLAIWHTVYPTGMRATIAMDPWRSYVRPFMIRCCCEWTESRRRARLPSTFLAGFSSHWSARAMAWRGRAWSAPRRALVAPMRAYCCQVRL